MIVICKINKYAFNCKTNHKMKDFSSVFFVSSLKHEDSNPNREQDAPIIYNKTLDKTVDQFDSSNNNTNDSTVSIQSHEVSITKQTMKDTKSSSTSEGNRENIQLVVESDLNNIWPFQYS